MAERILTLRELNRATLARQFLLERASLTPLDAINHLVALQGRVSNAPYINCGAVASTRHLILDFPSSAAGDNVTWVCGGWGL